MKDLILKISTKTVINARSADEMIDLLKLLKGFNGMTWVKDSNPSIMWGVYQSGICYHLHGKDVGHIDDYVEKGFEVITAKDFFRLHNIN